MLHYIKSSIKIWQLKAGLSPSKHICAIFVKNVYYFILKALFVLKIVKILSRFFGYVEKNGLIRKIRLTTKFMTSQHGLKTVAINKLPKISQSKGNQTMKYGK